MKPLDPLDLTRRLLDIESLTYNEGAVGEYLDGFLRERGFTVERTAVPQPPQSSHTGSHYKGPRFNVYAGIGKPPDVVLSTHMDTVPPFIPCREDDLYLYGRGTCDAKGIIAAQVAAAERLREAGVAVALLFVVGEERDSAGAKEANLHPRGSRFLINGEPTDNRLALASKGVLRVEVRAHGTMAHSAYPELGDSAVHKLVQVLERLRPLPLPSADGVGPSTLNIGVIEGGRAPNVIADTNDETVPSNLMRQGNFSELLGPNIFYPAGTKIYEPGTCPVLGAPTCVAYPGNIIPQSQWGPNGMWFINAYPPPPP